jgi:ABC-type multidrug transport system ATPase subunit
MAGRLVVLVTCVCWWARAACAVGTAPGVDAAMGVPAGERVSLRWDRLSCRLERKGCQRHLLQDVCGAAQAGRMLAIMGPSGSGKTTLLNSLSGQLTQSKGLRLEGRVHVNGNPANGEGLLKLKKAFVRQEDIFYTQMTVRETLLFHAKLRLPKGMSKSDKAQKVEAILSTLSLQKCADTLVGGEKVRGISGGERKRLNIGCELIASPSLIFLDEPTTGMQYDAKRVVEKSSMTPKAS